MPKAFYFAKSPGMDRNTEPFWVVRGGISGNLREFALHEVKIHGPVQQQTLTTVRGLTTKFSKMLHKALEILTNTSTTDLLIIKPPLLVEIIRAHEIFGILKMKNNKNTAAGENFLR